MTTATATRPTTDEKIVDLPLDQLHESPFNPRRTFSEKGLDELATDLRDIGILQPLRVRPIVPPLFSDQFAAGDESVITGWEVVFGHRRRRAAIMAELKTAPCIVRVMTDAEARRAQISENLQRDDVHPIEEAEGFQALMDLDGLTADDIAEQTGKSRSYVYGRLKLLQACPRVRDACLAGTIGSEVALLVARLRTAKLQEKALAFIDREYRANLEDGGKASFRAIRSLLNEKFTLDLKKDAIFDIEDATLVPAACRCSSCPKRSGNAPEFVDITQPERRKANGYDIGTGLSNDGPNVCTDPDCFDAKKTAHLKRAAAALASPSVMVVTGNAARSAMSAQGEVKGSYIAANLVKGVPKAGSGKAVLDKAQGKPVPVLVKIQDPRTGSVFDAYKVADLKAAGVKMAEAKPKRGGYDHGQYERERKEREAKANAVTAARTGRWQALRTAMASTDRTAVDLTLLLDYMLMAHTDRTEHLLTEAWGFKRWDALVAAAPGMSRDDKARLIMDIVTACNVETTGYDYQHPAEFLDRACEAYGVPIADGAPTPSTAGAGADDAAAGAGAGLVATGGGASDVDEIEDDEGGASGPQSSQTTPAGAGGSTAPADAYGTAAWPFPKQRAA